MTQITHHCAPCRMRMRHVCLSAQRHVYDAIVDAVLSSTFSAQQLKLTDAAAAYIAQEIDEEQFPLFHPGQLHGETVQSSAEVRSQCACDLVP